MKGTLMLSKADSLTYKAAQRVKAGESLEETLLEIREIRIKQNISSNLRVREEDRVISMLAFSDVFTLESIEAFFKRALDRELASKG